MLKIKLNIGFSSIIYVRRNNLRMKFFKRIFGRKTANHNDDRLTQLRPIERTWSNLPSVATTPVYEPFSFRKLTSYILKQTKKDLISIVPYGWDTSFSEQFYEMDHFWEFAEDSSLVAMFRDSKNKQRVQVIIRASFMKRAATQIEATTWCELIDKLSIFAAECNLRTIKL